MRSQLGRRVQLVPDAWPTLHLEASIPAWHSLRVGGLVQQPATFDLAALEPHAVEAGADRDRAELGRRKRGETAVELPERRPDCGDDD